MNGGANTLVGAAATDVARHRRVDIGVGRFRCLGEQRCSRHDLAGLAVAALRHVDFHPRLLHRVATIFREPLDGGDFLVADGADRRDAGANGLAVQMHGTGAAERHAATVFGAGQTHGISQHPQQRRLRVYIDLDGAPIDVLTSEVLEQTYGAPMEVLLHEGMPVVLDHGGTDVAKRLGKLL